MSFLRFVLASALLALSIMATPARADWLKGESEHFVVYGNTSERSMRSYVQKLERFDQVLRAHFPTGSEFIPPRLPIYLVGSHSDMEQVWPGIPSSVGGFYARGDERIFAMATDDGEGDSVLLHEYTHHFLFQNFTRSYPSWFTEGFAEYFATADLTPGRIKIGLFSPGRMNSLSGGANTWAPMEAILAPADERGRRAAGHQFYAQSWALTHYMMSTPERQAMLSAYLLAVGSGVAPAQAILSATGRTPVQLQTDVQRYLSGPITSKTLLRDFPDADVTVSRMTAVERDAQWLDLRLARFVPEARRAGNLSQARALAARYPGEPLTAQVLAQAFLDMKQPADAVSTLEPIVEAHPDSVQSLRMLAVGLMDQGDALGDDVDGKAALYAKARRHLANAYRIEEGDWRIYLALARNREGMAGYPTDNDVETLRIAASLAPQLPSVRIRTAAALIHHDRFVEAILQLEPIYGDPHGGTGWVAARRLLTQAYAGANVTPPAGFVPVTDPAESDGPDDEAENGG